MKKIRTLLTSLALGLTVAAESLAPIPVHADTQFSDVNNKAYYADAVKWGASADNGITSGTTPTTFSPDQSCTRGQMVTFLYRFAGSPKVERAMPFGDVTTKSFCYDAVNWASYKGITSGTTPTTFSPDQPCTRAQMITFMYRYAGSPKVEQDMPFKDISRKSFCYDAVNWAASKGITSGTTPSTFSPDQPCLRAQGMTFIYHFNTDTNGTYLKSEKDKVYKNDSENEENKDEENKTDDGKEDDSKKIDPSDPNALKNAQQAVKDAEAALAKAQDTLSTTTATKKQAEFDVKAKTAAKQQADNALAESKAGQNLEQSAEKKDLNSAVSALESAKANYGNAEIALQSAQKAYDDASVKYASAASLVPSDADLAAKQKTADDAAAKETETQNALTAAQQAQTAAQAKVTEAQAAYDRASHESAQVMNSKAFFEWCMENDSSLTEDQRKDFAEAVKILDGTLTTDEKGKDGDVYILNSLDQVTASDDASYKTTYNDAIKSTDFMNPNDATSIVNLKRAVNRIKRSNEYRAQESRLDNMSRSFLHVSPVLMAMAEVDINYTGKNIETTGGKHPLIFAADENLATSDDPVQMWYNEKGQTIKGHYVTLVLPYYTVTGFGVLGDADGIINTGEDSWQQYSSQLYSLNDNNLKQLTYISAGFDPDTFMGMVESYESKVQAADPASLQSALNAANTAKSQADAAVIKAQADYNSAVAAHNKANQALSNMQGSKSSTEKAAESAKSTMDAKKDALDKAQAAFNSAKAAQDNAQADYNKKNEAYLALVKNVGSKEAEAVKAAQQALDAAQKKLDQAKAAEIAAQADVAVKRAALERAKAALAKLS